ncbi:MAG: glycogen synthase GlgA [Chromatiaceae bacterium]|jgi:starch synthase|nr:glycogen synthase GlgA [Chromatiaceae bacterium]
MAKRPTGSKKAPNPRRPAGKTQPTDTGAPVIDTPQIADAGSTKPAAESTPSPAAPPAAKPAEPKAPGAAPAPTRERPGATAEAPPAAAKAATGKKAFRIGEPPEVGPGAVAASKLAAPQPDGGSPPAAATASAKPTPGAEIAAATPEPGAKAQPAPEAVAARPAEPPAPVESPRVEPAVEAPTPVEAEAPLREAESVHIEEPVPAEAPEMPAEHHPEVHHQPHYRPSLFIVQISPEMAPVAKVGGLADVVFGLTRELAIRGNHVEVILPKYDNLRYDHIYDLQQVFNDLWVPWYGGAIHCTVYFGFVHGRKCFFIEPHSGDNFFNRGSIYGFADDVMRYAFFSRAAMEFLFKAGKHPDVIHCHDWQTALAPVFLYEIYQFLGMTHPRACLTIHNFKHQGVTGMEVLRATGLHQPERYVDYNRLRDNHNPHALNLLKGGIVYSNFVTTVSPRYAFETKDGGQGFGLEPTLHTHHMKYGGVVNGIDYDVWNPEVDHHIPVRYGLDNIDGKYDNKRALRHRLMLADNEKPIVAFIGRLDPQKGLDLVRHAIFFTLERGGQFVLLGSSPDHGINADFWGLKRMLNDSPDCHLEIGFDEDLSHLIYAGADMMLVPSRFEPCGLTQLIALRYGTIPVVRAIGGLADTVFDKDFSDRPLHERNGYVFENYDQPGLESALGRAIACYYHHPDHFRELIKNAMRFDYSWNRPGEDYLNIYDYIRQK